MPGVSATAALERLREGNLRFAADRRSPETTSNRTRRNELVTGQHPFAIVLGCSDSRVPAEVIFDQGLGDLFVIRVAGNIVARSQVGSVEYAVEQFGVRLVLVLGHSKCGAVIATLEELERPGESRSPNLRFIVDRITPAVIALANAGEPASRDELLARAVRTNIRASVDNLLRGSEIIEGLINNGRLLVVGAEYSLETGLVEFLDDQPDGD